MPSVSTYEELDMSMFRLLIHLWIIIVIALTTSEVILREDLKEAKSWGETISAVVKFMKIRARANGYIAASWGLSTWAALDRYIKGCVIYHYYLQAMASA